MRTTYAVNWQEQAGTTSSGKLELRARSVFFEGLDAGEPRTSEVSYRDISAVRVARMASDRLGGRPTLIVDRRRGPTIRIASVAQSGIVSELAEHLAAVHLKEERPVGRVVVVIPLVAGAHERVLSLVRDGPPFDPEEAGLERHHVFLTDEEVVFVFEGETAKTLDGLAHEAEVWTAASGWAEVAAGLPRVAEDVYDWVRPETPENVAFTPTPGPGDSEGGDVYPP